MAKEIFGQGFQKAPFSNLEQAYGAFVLKRRSRVPPQSHSPAGQNTDFGQECHRLSGRHPLQAVLFAALWH